MALRRPHKGMKMGAAAPGVWSRVQGRGWVPAPAYARAGSSRERRVWRGTSIFIAMTVVRGVSIGGKVVGALRYAPVKAPALLRVIGLQGRQRWIPAFAGNTMALRRPHKGMKMGAAAPGVWSRVQGRGWVPAPAYARAGSSRERRVWRGTSIFIAMTVVRGVSIGGKVVGALRYAPVKAPALLRVIGLQGRQRWIPAFAGMTVMERE